jgi:pimeloyl-ACP methyl ester carboxylesterase
VELYSEVAGEGPELVLLHEGIWDCRMWDRQWETYAGSHRLLRLDFRGYGRTPLEPGSFASGSDVLGLMDRRGFDRAALVGVSLGGRVALEVALAAPERVTALVLVGSGLPGIEDVDPDVRARVAEMQRRAFELQRTAEDEEELFVDDVAERLERIANTAHVPSMEREQEFDRLVLGFLAEVA